MVEKYIKKPVMIEAVLWDGSNIEEIKEFVGDKLKYNTSDLTLTLIIKTLEGNHICSLGDYIIKGIHGEFYPCKPDIFEKTYYTVEEYNYLQVRGKL